MNRCGPRGKPGLLGCLFLVQVRANGQGVIGIDRAVAFLDVLDDAVFIDDDIGTLGPIVALALNVARFEDAVGSEHFLVHVAQQREFNPDLLGEGGVGGRRVNTDAEDFRVAEVDLAAVDSRLDRLELLRSTTGEGEHVDREEDVLLSLKIAELHRFPLIAQQSEIGSFFADLQRNLRQLFVFLSRPGQRRNNRRGSQQDKRSNEAFHA